MAVTFLIHDVSGKTALIHTGSFLPLSMCEASNGRLWASQVNGNNQGFGELVSLGCP